MLAACPHDVNLTLHNSTLPAQALAPSVQVTHAGIPGSAIGLNQADTNSSVTKTIKMEDGDSYIVKAALPGSAIVFKTDPVTITSSDPKEISTSIEMKVQGRWVDPNDSTTIENAFSQLGKNVGFNPEAVQKVNDSLFGGLVIFTVPQQGEATFDQLVPPGVLTPASTWSEADYPNTVSQDSTGLTTNSSARVNASVPLYGTLAGSFAANSVYKVDWDMEGFGEVPKKEDPAHSDFVAAMSSLSVALKTDICTRLQNNTNSALMYVNKMYVVKRVALTVTKGDQITSAIDLTGVSLVAGSLAYKFEADNSHTQHAEGQVENVGGPTWTKDTAPICSHPANPHAEQAESADGGQAQQNRVPETRILPGRAANAALEVNHR